MELMLLTETFDLAPFMDATEWLAQAKADGERCAIQSREGVITATGRSGRAVALPPEVSARAFSAREDFIVDGELVGDEFFAFDVVQWGGIDVRAWPFEARATILPETPFLFLAAIPAIEKMIAELHRRGSEGVVFCRRSAPYRGERSPDKVRFKFRRSETFIVTAVDIARGVAQLERDGIARGGVSFPANGRWPTVGDLCEVVFDKIHASGKLCRAAWKGLREDVTKADLLPL